MPRTTNSGNSGGLLRRGGGGSGGNGRRRKKLSPTRKVNKTFSFRNLICFITVLGVSIYLIVWMQFVASQKAEQLAKEATRKERRERSLEKRKQLQDNYKQLKKVRKDVKEREDRVVLANSKDSIEDFEKNPPQLIQNPIRIQKDEHRIQQQNLRTPQFKQHFINAKGIELEEEPAEAERTSTITSPTAMYNSSTPLFLEYKLHKNQPYNITYGQFTKCHLGIKTNKWGRKPIERLPLHREMKFLEDFTTSISTNMKILSLGDSVGIQFHQILEEAVSTQPQDRHVLEYAWGEHESIAVAQKIDGGGLLASFRMTGMFLEKNRGKPPPNSPGGGWLPEHVSELLDYKHTMNYIDKGITTSSIQNFDAMIFRIPHGWLKLNEITKETVTESIMTAKEQFGIKYVVLLTLYFNNNVETLADLQQLHETNTMIRDLVENWDSGQTQIQILLMDFGNWVDQLIEKNAQLAGMDTTPRNYTLARLGCMKKYPPSLAMICTDVVPEGSCTCKRNMISIDGLHWCMESVGGRTIASIGCLLQCPLLSSTTRIKECEKTCNQKFMSMDSITETE